MTSGNVSQFYWGLGDVVSDIIGQTDIRGDEVDLGSVVGTVKGYVATNATAFTLLNELGGIHLFDILNADARVIIMPREWATETKVKEEDLILNDNGTFIKQDAASEDLPSLVHVRYFDITGGNSQSIQTSENVYQSIGSGEEVMDINEIMEAADAKQIAVIQHKIKAQLAKGKVSFSLPKKHANLTVGDVVYIGDLRLRITKASFDILKQDYEAMHDRRSAYSATLPALVPPTPTAPPSTVYEPPLIAFFDIPDFLENDELGLYYAVSRTSAPWRGVHIEISADGSYWDFFEFQYNEGLFATVQEPIKAHEAAYPDRFNEIIVKTAMPSDRFPSLTHREMLDRKGMLLVGNEIISYKNSELIDEQTYKLTYLLRGRLGTAPQAHTAGTRVISLSQGEIPFAQMEQADIGRVYQAKAEMVDDESKETMTTLKLEGNGVKEQAPARVRVVPQGANMRIEWSPVGKKSRGGVAELGKYTTGAKVRVGSGAAVFVPLPNNFLVVPTSASIVGVKMTNSITGDGPETTAYRR